MRAVLMWAPNQVDVAEVRDPACGPEEVLLRTEAVSVCSTDISYFRGHLIPPAWPIIPGHEYVGRVVQVGARVDPQIQVDDRLVYWGQTDFGGLAELRAIRPLLPNQRGETRWYTERNFYDAHQAAVVRIPEDMPAKTATLIEPLTSVLRSLLVNPPRPGDVCLVLGCGPSGLLAVQVLVRVLGAGSVVVIDRDQARIEAAVALGAERGINSESAADELAELIRESNDQFADYLFDALPHVPGPHPGGGNDPRQLGMGLLRPGGTYVVYGAAESPQAIQTWLILAKGLRLQATPFDVRSFPMARSTHVMRVALDLIRSGVVLVDPLVTQCVPIVDEKSTREIFTNYGAAGQLKTSISFAPDPVLALASADLLSTTK